MSYLTTRSLEWLLIALPGPCSRKTLLCPPSDITAMNERSTALIWHGVWQVMWHLGTDVKQFLPRLGAPITSITACTHDHAKFVVSQANNAIRVVQPRSMSGLVALLGDVKAVICTYKWA